VKTKQNGSVRIQQLTKVIMRRTCLGLAEERLIPPEAGRNVTYADDRPCAFNRILAVGSNGLSRGCTSATLIFKRVLNSTLGALRSTLLFGAVSANRRLSALLLFTPRFSEVPVRTRINPSRFNGFRWKPLKRFLALEPSHSTSLKRGVNERAVKY
jgi:hypothetical protein